MSERRMEIPAEWLDALIVVSDDVPEGEIHFLHEGDVVFKIVNVSVNLPTSDPAKEHADGQ